MQVLRVEDTLVTTCTAARSNSLAYPRGADRASERVRKAGLPATIVSGRYGIYSMRCAVLLALATACSGCSSVGPLDPQGPVGAAEKLILINSLAIMLTIVVPTILATLAFAWWFRASNTKAVYRPDFVYSGQIELIVWSIPILVILLLGGIAWISSHELDPAQPLDSARKKLEVQVVSLDWKWLFIYPEQGIATVNQLVVPAATPIHFSLTSASVLNAFFVPQLGSMIYTMNGMTTQLNLQSDRPGRFHGLSSHFSGDGFSGMSFELQAVTDGEFDRWVAEAKRAGPILDENAYVALSAQSLDERPAIYRGVVPNLFHSIVMQELAPGPGPDAGSPHPVAPIPER
ncbi:MAG: Ubiquinol oxidase subunit 2 [Rhodospirillales bacterium]|nr:Ubiquinol oxidase subunit 2 [Rhodospirillales bacterium]